MTEAAHLTPQDVSKALELQAIYLHECHVTRGDAEHATPGTVDGDIAATFTQDEPGVVLYLVKVTTGLHNSDSQLMAKIETTFAALYAIEGVGLSEEDLKSYEATVRYQIHPYLRETLASLTNRMGLPTFTAPVLQVRMQRPPEDVAAGVSKNPASSQSVS